MMAWPASGCQERSPGQTRSPFAHNPSVPNCDNCGAPARIDRERGLIVCDHCGTQQELPALFEHLELLSETRLLCPLCTSPLFDGRLEDLPVQVCARCFGMLISMDLFTTIIDVVRAREDGRVRAVLPRKQNPGDREIDCPVCRNPMLNHVYAGPGNIVIDTCERCFLNWLDPGELRRIVVAPDTRRLSEPPADSDDPTL
jgi:Zn-finger nucleic acid-binding protein